MIRKLLPQLFFILLAGLPGGSALHAQCSGPGGLITVGPGGTHPTLTAALSSLSGGISAPVVLELQSGYTSTAETFPITINANACFDAVNTLTIRPASNAPGLVISSATAATPTIDFNGAKYVTLDGTPGGDYAGNTIGVTVAGTTNTTNLNIINTATTGVAIRLNNEASFNTIKFCDLQGRNTTNANLPASMAGVVYIGNTGANGNDNNTIDHCNIHGTAAIAFPSMGIFVLGANNTGLNSNFNDNGTISNNNIYDYFLPNGNSTGIELTQGVNHWTITGNSLFQTGNKSYTSGNFNRAIWIAPNRNAGSVGNGFNITGNYIGGTAPQCGNTPYTLSAFAHTFSGIRLEIADGAVPDPSSVQGNVISNMTISSTSTVDVFQGIAVVSSAGSVNIGTTTGNTIGTTTGNSSISIAGGSGSHTTGIFLSNAAAASSAFNVKNNKLGGITISTTGSNFSGIYNNQAGIISIEQNQVGSLITPASIQSTSTAAATRFMRGINMPSGSATISISGNTIANLSNATTATTAGSSQTIGVFIGSTTPDVTLINDNTIFNLSCAAAQPGSGINMTLGGIVVSSNATTPCTITGNKIYALTATSASVSTAIQVAGLYTSGTATVRTISKNFIHSLDVTANNPMAMLQGINVASGTGAVENNMIRLGLRPDGSALTSALSIQGVVTGTGPLNVYHNSVYIGGGSVNAGTATTAALVRTGAAGDDIRNNIWVNNRSNGSSGANHYAMFFSPSAAGATINYNIYRAAGTNGVFAFDGTADVPAYTSGWVATDVNSLTADPQFLNPTGDTSVLNLHISASVPTPVEGNGIVLSVPNDIDGDNRLSFTPADIGADAGNFTTMPLPVTLSAFYGIAGAVKNDLYWYTAAEGIGDKFVLERSEDGKRFSSIAVINAKGIGSVYTYNDPDPPVKAYYRLQLTAEGNKPEFSNVVKLFRNTAGLATVLVRPNPAKSILKLTIRQRAPHASFRICDVAGRVVSEMQVTEEELTLDVSLYSKGIYRLSYQDDARKYTTSFIKD